MSGHAVSQHLELRPVASSDEPNEHVFVAARHPMQSDGQNTMEMSDEELDRQTVRKLDLILLPFLALLFLFNSLDRSNIGNAETADFTKDVGLKPEDLNTAVAVFFAFFVTLQPVGAALGRKFGMAVWVPGTMAAWGLCTMLHIWVRSKWQLILLRIVIGSLEAGFYPTTVSYLSLFYTRYEFARRLGMFYGQYAIAGALGGILSYAVFSRFGHSPNDTASGWKSWQVLFLVEGGLTMLLAILGFLWLPHNAKSAWFLNANERIWAEKRIILDREKPTLSTQQSWDDGEAPYETQNTQSEETEGLLNQPSDSHSDFHRGRSVTDDRGLSLEDILEAVLDWKLWYLLICNILSAIPVTAFSVFLPLVLKSVSSTPAQANLLSAPPFLFGAVVLYAFTYWSDKKKIRLVPVLWSLALLVIGLVGVAGLPPSWAATRYLFLCILLSGTFVASPLMIAWFAGNLPEPGKRSIVLGINGWGNLAGVFSSLLFHPSYGPSYIFPFVVTLFLIIVSFVGYAIFHRALISINAKRRALLATWSAAEVEAEKKFGQGPVPQSKNNIAAAVFAIFLGERYGRQIRDIIRSKDRRGDEKITFQYTL